MNRILPVIIICQILMLICLPAVNGQESSGPKLVLEKNIFDAKEVKEGDIISHTFTVLNRGDSVLRINRVKPG